MDLAWIALSLLPHVGGKTLRILLDTFGTTQEILQASDAELQRVRGIGSKISASIRQIDLAALEQRLVQWQQAGVQIITLQDPAYPEILSQLEDPPPTLFARGSFDLATFRQGVALVGTRSPSPQGRAVTLRLAAAFAQQGWTIVSGLALGIDTAAHQGAVSVPGATTLAVTGSGVLNVYPPQNQRLAQAVMQHGLLLSENDPTVTATAPRLVSRNRIITGLCRHVVVVETNRDGGAMYAAEVALRDERRLHVVTLPASGNRLLLERGAVPIPADTAHWSLD